MDPRRRAALLEIARRRALVDTLRGELHPRQRDVFDCEARRIALTAGRRSGKTNVIERLIVRELEAANRDEFVGYAAKTRVLAKDLIWAKLKYQNEKHKLGWRFLEQDGVITTPKGALFRLGGFDDIEALEKVRGYKCRAYFLDEIATVADKAEYVVKEALGPAMIDLNGLLVVAGTPGPALEGWWYKVSVGHAEQPGWARFHWNMLSNPFLDDIEAKVEEVLRSNAWTREHPQFRREYLGEWVPDANALVFGDFDPRRHIVPRIPRVGMSFALGIDFGVVDPCAFTVLGWTPGQRRAARVTHAHEVKGKDPQTISQEIRTLVETWNPLWVVGDGGGQGAAFVLDFNTRYAEELRCWIEPAHKPDVVGQVSVVNHMFRGNELFIEQGVADSLVASLTTTLWADGTKTKVKRHQNDHGCDSLRYLVNHTAQMRAIGKDLAQRDDPLKGFDERVARRLAAEHPELEWGDWLA